MAGVAHGLGTSRLRRGSGAGPVARGWRPVWSSAAAIRAVRAAVVVPGLFALTDQVIGNLQMATFAAFGGFATLVLSSFAGTRRDKLLAHTALAIAGSVLLTIGTAVSHSTLLAALVTVPVTFAVFYAGAAGPNAASSVTGALLAYVLPAASPGTIAMIPDRLAGWWLASVAGTAAVLMLSPPPGDDRLRAAAAKLAAALGEVLEGALRGPCDARLLAEIAADERDLVARFTATPYRPTGLAVPDEALANCVELLQWLAALVADAAEELKDLDQDAGADRELLAAASAVLVGVAGLFDGGRQRPDLERLQRARSESLAALAKLSPGQPGFREASRASFHSHAIAGAVLALGADALVASRLADPDRADAEERHPHARAAGFRAARRLSGIAGVALRDASLRSVWFINSLRGSVALAAAVAIADVSSVQHGFWVVLGALSVLRTNAVSTGSSALHALLGTALGFVIGGALLLAIGTDSTALWVALPIAVFVAAYAPGTVPFAIGQAAFTVMVAVLFNLLAPVGWKVGVVRIEDVALGVGVSVIAGTLFWPRGLSSLVGDDLADAFRAAASHLAQAVARASGSRPREPDRAAASARAALRLDDALRAFATEQGTKHMEMPELWRLVGGSLRLRLTAQLVAGLPPGGSGAGATRAALEHRTGTLVAWYERLAELLERPRRQAVLALEPPKLGPQDVVPASSNSHYGIWLCENLDHLAEHLADLIAPAMRVAEARRKPWWR
ncbi:MAG TPA: FUSC family protein [Solirubrobacteraceae bacterium]|nr:FUSC family protein [Solirubrobacteraceae bacterium]